MKTKTTLTFKILCSILLIASLTYCFCYPFVYLSNYFEISRGHSDLFVCTDNSKEIIQTYCVQLIPTTDSTATKIVTDTQNSLTGEKVRIRPNDEYGVTIQTIKKVTDTDSTHLNDGTIYIAITSVIVLVLIITFFILFIKLIRSFSISLIFDKTNSRRLLWMGILMICLGIWEVATPIYNVLKARSEIVLEGYEITFPMLHFESILFGMGILVMNEILRLATSIKEDQDLTI
ncbi:MAG: DUF2975 domain-containing protein [Paludibacteraceae bacterium]|nr:DUF2975 domain-containing protein [Paludibacteraceae bacterium]